MNVDVLFPPAQPQLNVRADGFDRGDACADAKTLDEYEQTCQVSMPNARSIVMSAQLNYQPEKFAAGRHSPAIQPADKHPPTRNDSKRNVRRRRAPGCLRVYDRRLMSGSID